MNIVTLPYCTLQVFSRGREDSAAKFYVSVNLKFERPIFWVDSVLILFEFVLSYLRKHREVTFIRVDKFWPPMHRSSPDVRSSAGVFTVFFLVYITIKCRFTVLLLHLKSHLKIYGSVLIEIRKYFDQRCVKNKT